MSEQPAGPSSSSVAINQKGARRATVHTALSFESSMLKDISTKLDRVVAVLAAQGKERERQVEILSAGGCDSSFIGTVVGMTAGAVRTLQSRQRSKAARASTADAPAANSGAVDS